MFSSVATDFGSWTKSGLTDVKEFTSSFLFSFTKEASNK